MIRMSFVMLTVIAFSAGCSTTTPENKVPDIRDNDPMIVQLSSTARQAFDMGEIPKAVVMYRRALDRARAMDNPREIGRNAHNLAACLMALEDWDDIPPLLHEAERETVRAGDDPGPILLLRADSAISQKKWTEAEQAIDRLELMDVSDSVRGQAYVTRARIACERGNASLADGFITRARGYLRKQQEPGLAGAIAEVSGHIAELNSQWDQAAAAYDREAAWMQKSGRLPEMADALERAGVNYTKADMGPLASDRFYRSARSLMAQGNYLDALRVVEQAVQLVDPESDASSGKEIAQLFEEIRASVEKKSRAGLNSPQRSVGR